MLMLKLGIMFFFSIEQISLPKHDEENSFQGFWKMSFDGACSKYGNGVGIVFKISQSSIYSQPIKLEFPCTNNEVEYEALIQGMILSLQMKFENMVVTSDSELVINHIRKKYRFEKEKLKHYARRVCELMNYLNSFNSISFVDKIIKNQIH